MDGRPLSSLGMGSMEEAVYVRKTGGMEGSGMGRSQMMHYGKSKGDAFFMGLGLFILWFILLTVFVWLIIYSVRPGWVLYKGTNKINTSIVLVASIVIALVIILILWLLKVGLSSYRW